VKVENDSMTTLVIAAHPDDEVLGCGASIAKWSDAGEEVHVLIMAEGGTSRGATRDTASNREELLLLENAVHQAADILGTASIKLLSFPDNRMDSLDRLDVVKAVEVEVERLKPEIVITHHCGDVNIDHRVIHESVVTACRPQPGHPVHRLLAFEVPSSTEWQPPNSNISFQPNWFEDVSETIDHKLEAMSVYQSEIREWPHSRSLESIEHLARWRGGSIGCEAAESFVLMRELR
jgi:N-acetylglucosamine malate deacetylase 1